MERWLREAERRREKPPEELPLALAREGPHGPVIHALNPAARLLGLTCGARVADMRALCPDLLVRDADLAGDAEALARLSHWARRWAPWSAVDGADGMALDTTGSDHLRGGEPAMLADMEARFGAAGLSVRLAIAPTRGAAWAMARHGSPGARICADDGVATALAPLPVEALRLDGETVLLLRRLGLKTIGRLLEIPRAAIARRFGQDGSDLPLRLDQALGRIREPLDAPEDPAVRIARIDLPDAVQDPLPYLADLVRRLCARLRDDGLGLRRMRLRIYRVDGEVRAVAIACARASRDAAHLARLFDGRLEGLDPGFGFDLLTLEALAAEPLPASQSHLYEDTRRAMPLPDLVDRLVARFGEEAVRWPGLRESHLPERAETAADALEAMRAALRQGGAGPMMQGMPPPSGMRPAHHETIVPFPEDRDRPEGGRDRARRGGVAIVARTGGAPKLTGRDSRGDGRVRPTIPPENGLTPRKPGNSSRRDEVVSFSWQNGNSACPSDVRPLRLLEPAEEIRVIYAVPEGPPLHFAWRRRRFRVARQQGPERIAPEWWRDCPQARLRDYFRIEVTEGPRFWIFREGLNGDGRGGPPRWFLHGIFA
jgi:nucleotidyltransferase/DNA polymerase involved in DNA repair